MAEDKIGADMLYKLMSSRLDENSLRDMCFYMSNNSSVCEDLEYDRLGGNDWRAKSLELIKYSRKRCVLVLLIDQIDEVRPDILNTQADIWRKWASAIDASFSTLSERGLSEGKMSVLTSGDEQVIVVSKTGHGDYQTIGDAISNATPGSFIVVQPSAYMEELVIDKPLVIISGGISKKAVIVSATNPCFKVQADYVELRGLMIRRVSTHGVVDDQEGAAVYVSKGKLLMNQCDVSSEAGSCIIASGPKAEINIKECAIHGGMDGGLTVTDQASASLEDSSIYNNFPNNFSAQINICSGSASIRRCKIWNGVLVGVSVRGSAYIEDCSIFNNLSHNVLIEDGSSTLIRCNVFNSNHNGIQVGNDHDVSEGSSAVSATIENCTIFNNEGYGIAVAVESTVNASACTLFDNKGYSSDGSKSKLQSNYNLSATTISKPISSEDVKNEEEEPSNETDREQRTNDDAKLPPAANPNQLVPGIGAAGAAL